MRVRRNDPKKIAIVGSGISGLAAAHELHPDHEITVFEADRHVGGHVYTQEVEDAGRPLAVDLGFIVYNERTYPELVRLFDEARVETRPSDMGFSVSCETTGLEWAGSSLETLFAQRRNLLRPRFWRMVAGISKLGRRGRALSNAPAGMTLGQFLEEEGIRGPVVDWYLVPMISAVWSTEPARMLEFPARTLGRFLENHGLLQVSGRPRWRVVEGGSARYVERLTAPFAERILCRTPVLSIRRLPDGVDIETLGGDRRRFDGVVVATHSDQALRLLADPTPAERSILGTIPYTPNDVVLHTDENLMPRRRRAWAAWNYHLQPEPVSTVRVTYWMNRLQGFAAERDYFVTLNRTGDIRSSRILHRVTLAHPLFTAESETAKARWAEISSDRTVYAGAYWRYGFHEDGARSGLRAARVLRASLDGREAAEAHKALELEVA